MAVTSVVLDDMELVSLLSFSVFDLIYFLISLMIAPSLLPNRLKDARCLGSGATAENEFDKVVGKRVFVGHNQKLNWNDFNA